MNSTEILLIHTRLKHALGVAKVQFRKPTKERNQRALNKAKDSIKTLNRWLYSNQNTSTITNAKNFRKAISRVRRGCSYHV